MGGNCTCVGDEAVHRVLMLGLKSAGKSTILNIIKEDQQIRTFQVNDFNTQTIKWEDYELVTWDLGSAEKQRPLWRHYYDGSVAVIFVVDCSDKEKIQLAKTEIHKIAAVPELTNCPILFLANKQDVDGAIDQEELEKLIDAGGTKHLTYSVMPCSATTNKGIEEAFDWLLSKIKEHIK
ncbi:small GTP-binding protein, putative [Trichomonas vaginalis G3]|uniref:Small GTP-binding protein, putative n=1 Tax=Trichomonas vaginalis (strain ATCC PRA-98 / G3) TaxID=412133 RepID=A2ENB1_TRIV3|nr:small GTPase superfamily, Arf family [Trichomonas vaginalis G3]EAY05870.1 small GTP-binding protein, putative [Trichomonas vaginalis G3]KAI5531679.1 small GTPase superfamily, Arf family [Trichomonas vaginalis G3]|eukprot:XP_001318093.1 small GTP-binding protein [Trichomonas vaginalis G3]